MIEFFAIHRFPSAVGEEVGHVFLEEFSIGIDYKTIRSRPRLGKENKAAAFGTNKETIVLSRIVKQSRYQARRDGRTYYVETRTEPHLANCNSVEIIGRADQPRAECDTIVSRVG